MSNRKFPITKAIRTRRRLQAEARQAKYDLLTTQQKIDALPPEPYAKKQRAKLLLRLESEVSRVGNVDHVENGSSEHLKAKDRRAKERKGE